MRLVTFRLADGRPRLGAQLAEGEVLDLHSAAGGAAEFASIYREYRGDPVFTDPVLQFGLMARVRRELRS